MATKLERRIELTDENKEKYMPRTLCLRNVGNVSDILEIYASYLKLNLGEVLGCLYDVENELHNKLVRMDIPNLEKAYDVLNSGFREGDFKAYQLNLIGIAHDTFIDYKNPFYQGNLNPRKEMKQVRAEAIARTLRRKIRDIASVKKEGSPSEIRNAYVAPIGSGKRR